jgi:hypothetical protein
MGCILDNWVFFGEQKENGNIVRFAKSLLDMKIYRWEPVNSRLVGNEAGRFRKAISERFNLVAHCDISDLGILTVRGPYFDRGLLWLGWEARNGENLFPQLESRVTSLPQTINGLYPVIHSYLIYHQAGLVVGRPDWGRLFFDHRGIYMIDPSYMSYLAAPAYSPPLGLLGCRPPETFNGFELNQQGDLFYLGLIIYLAITNRLPFAISDQWPTKALLKGEIISPVVHQSNLSPLLAQQIKDLLNPNPERRGTIQQLDAFWHLVLEQRSYLATPQAQILNLQEQKTFFKKSWLHRFYKPIWVTATIASLLLMLIISQIFLMPILSMQQRLKANPLKAVSEFYRTFAGSPQTLLTAPMNPMLMNDFTQDRERRLKAATELLTQPLVTVQRTRLISNTNREAVVEVSITRWVWRNDSWFIQPYREILKLRRSGSKWTVIHREKI